MTKQTNGRRHDGDVITYQIGPHYGQHTVTLCELCVERQERDPASIREALGREPELAVRVPAAGGWTFVLSIGLGGRSHPPEAVDGLRALAYVMVLVIQRDQQASTSQ